jgi:hypothetical protein
MTKSTLKNKKTEIELNQDFEMFVDKMGQFFWAVRCRNLLRRCKTWVYLQRVFFLFLGL